MNKYLLSLAALTCAGSAFAVKSGSDLFLPSVGRGQGKCVDGVCAQWSMDAWVYNPGGQTAVVTVAFLLRDTDNTNAQTQVVNVLAGQTNYYPDILGSMFGVNKAFGALRFTSSTPILVTGRSSDTNVTTQKGQGTAGQLYNGISVFDSIGTNQATTLFGLDEAVDGVWRSNVAFLEATGQSTTVRIEVLNSATVVLATASYTLQPFESKQLDISAFGAPPGSNQMVRVTVTGGTGRVIASGSRIDNRTGDPSTVEMPAPGFEVADLTGTWTGVWSNTTYGTTGTASMTLTWNPATLGIQAVFTLGGNVFGGTAPPPQAFGGNLRGNGFVVSGNSPAFGAYSFTIGPTGRITGTLTGIPNPYVAGASVTGQVYGAVFALQYTLSLVGGGQATGLIFMTKTS